MPPNAYLNRVATAAPRYEVHRFFLSFAASMLEREPRQRSIFVRMADRAGIARRYSCFEPASDPEGATLDAAGLFRRGAFPGTAKRMELYEAAAPQLAKQAVDRLLQDEDRSRITHLIVTTCTGFSAPGIDLELVARCGLRDAVERTIIGFMGCYAAINALKLARHIVRSDAEARVLIVDVEICTLHLKETADLEKLLSFCLWGDGCAAALVTAEAHGLQLDTFCAVVAPQGRQLMTWSIHDNGFDMVLSGQVPGAINETLGSRAGEIFADVAVGDVDLWAVHPGGRSVLDAVERALDLDPRALDASRGVLHDYGNMSSATVMFVIERMLKQGRPGQRGCAMAFGPGLTAETMMFRTAG
ncbi:Predicted naringenin-chalcone synthase [Mesorhizobium albiziae]|uniref:Predicted naringenin-chalcone synthase n=1 Tax=Neomesorhizobium albiziae TaxID=335020 RepID=A0A1I4EAV1_9HYPH|nr:type III polyketide synthase [Mesorhizobium albiziae]GLS33820.1 naringenin-chalcone synthase [Mesorhizobium albiziae]SFL01506.1 Predicted naringenin-chalcone synthase [Mesorhizobium albiziae]